VVALEGSQHKEYKSKLMIASVKKMVTCQQHFLDIDALFPEKQCCLG
jgi:hypothetical protein